MDERKEKLAKVIVEATKFCQGDKLAPIVGALTSFASDLGIISTPLETDTLYYRCADATVSIYTTLADVKYLDADSYIYKKLDEDTATYVPKFNSDVECLAHNLALNLTNKDTYLRGIIFKLIIDLAVDLKIIPEHPRRYCLNNPASADLGYAFIFMWMKKWITSFLESEKPEM